MDTNTEAKSKDSGAQPTSSNKSKPNSTPGETSSKTKAATQGKQKHITTRDQGENHSSSKQLHKVQLEKPAMKETQTFIRSSLDIY